ncbi:AAA family ATPase [Candidatus Uhrbacteria bacterium]|nr:AAA family ATPase [Candidatus Uhrbacteria bacterium]
MTTTTPVRTTTTTSLLRDLGIVGYDSIEPVLIGALATELPLLLIGPHGTAKSLLLNWLAQAMQLTHRHYNAAMINFDDLIGFPFPNDARTSLDYIPTRGSIWGAQSVFIDEISRTRMDMQNRLFPIIHEKMIQGIPLTDLRFRWAAMNPPVNEDGTAGAELWKYEGSQPLDVALADRFPFVVTLPDFRTFRASDQLAIIRGLPEQEAPNSGGRLQQRVVATATALPTVRTAISEHVGAYVHALLPFLDKMHRSISPRRGHMLHDTICATIAADMATGARDPKTMTFLALSHGLPHPAYGQSVPPNELLVAHQQAWKLAEIPATDPRRVVFAESDPVRRVALALEFDLNDLDTSTLIQDAYAGLAPVDRICFSVQLYPLVSTTRNLTAIAFETIAKDRMEVENESERRHAVTTGSRRHEQWKRIANWISDQERATPEAHLLVNTALVLFEREVEFTTEQLEQRFQGMRSVLTTTRRSA